MNITVTGLDEFCNLDDAADLMGPDVEIGILVSGTPEGRNRYPRFEWIDEAIRYLKKSGRVSLHICGSLARQKLRECHFDDWFYVFGADRMQINGKVSTEEIDHICRRYPRADVITQHTEANAALAIAGTPVNHALLVDGSGGRGIAPAAWAAPETAKAVGFAGGLGVDTMPEALPQIKAIARPGWWVDMEGKLRDQQDRFSIDRAAAAIACFRRCVS